jgi:hypothetical protein
MCSQAAEAHWESVALDPNADAASVPSRDQPGQLEEIAVAACPDPLPPGGPFQRPFDSGAMAWEVPSGDRKRARIDSPPVPDVVVPPLASDLAQPAVPQSVYFPGIGLVGQ